MGRRKKTFEYSWVCPCGHPGEDLGSPWREFVPRVVPRPDLNPHPDPPRPSFEPPPLSLAGQSHVRVSCRAGGASRLGWAPPAPAFPKAWGSHPTPCMGWKRVGAHPSFPSFVAHPLCYAHPHFCTSPCLKKVINLKFIQSD